MDNQKDPRKDRRSLMADPLVKLPVVVVKYLTVSAVPTPGGRGTTVECSATRRRQGKKRSIYHGRFSASSMNRVRQHISVVKRGDR